MHNTNNNNTDFFGNGGQIERMKDNLIFGVVKNLKVDYIITPLKIDAKLNTYQQTEIFGIAAQIKKVKHQDNIDYILFSLQKYQTIGVTQHLFHVFDEANSEFCSHIDKFNLQ